MNTASKTSSSYSTSGIRATLVPDEDPTTTATSSTSNRTTTQANVLQVIEDSESGVISVHQQDLFFKGEPQPLEYRDKFFAIAFWLQWAALLVTPIVLGAQQLSARQEQQAEDQDNPAEAEDLSTTQANFNATASSGDSDASIDNFLPWLTGTCLSAVVVLGLCLVLLTFHARHMIKVSFFAAPIILGLFAAALCFSPDALEDGLSPVVFAVVGAVWALFSTCYYHFLKRYMPFAAANLQTALTAIRANQGLFLVSWGNGIASFVFAIVWSVSFGSVVNYVAVHNPQVPCVEGQADEDDNPDDGMCDAQLNFAVFWVFLFSLFWSQQVFKNVLNAVTAGTVGTWWFCTENGSSDWTAASVGFACGFRDVGDSLYRALTYSFGSICFGSLLVTIIQLLESMLHSGRGHRRGSALLCCVLECLMHLLRRWIEYFNAWAMVYVGLYGYDYLTSGKNVVNLFKTTGWTTFIADRLVFRVLMFCHLGIVVLTGGLSVLMDIMVGPAFADDNAEGNQTVGSHAVAFVVGMFLGLFLSSTALIVVESAVRTVIVCFAESPGEFAVHHPDLCEEMTRGWSETYPDAWASRRVPVMADASITTTTTHTDTDAEARRLVV